MNKKESKQDKVQHEKNKQKSAQKKTARTMSIVGIVIALLLIFSMLLTTIRF
ncbi:MAG: hypothetical protein AB9907_11115 [Flexilinea sp.]|jgi:hypothetical protein